MKKPFDLTKLPHMAAIELTKLAKLIVKAHLPVETRLSFNTGDLDPKRPPHSLLKKVEDWIEGDKEHRFIYYIHCDVSAGKLSKTRTKFSEAKTSEKEGRAYARFNPLHSSACWYVGSSSDIVRRFKEHLGYGARGTYALHLSSWAQELRIPLEIVVLRYGVEEKEEVIGALEDALWMHFRPMFGRKGRR